ncbi:DNA polymerase III subunit delta [Pseudobdellovibrio exovorus]|uniref:DNA polymerase III subunit delta n=1 Tax=Pseudobdellovibrio exovorus JSS TaxID=1184267 RepID=M4V9N3_9BACT|nr:DNA polymerase III subunit delta [Pseudobdellovibrio exovorus]AGH95923.1 DNA polymerase III, delta subunit [Pseudobdellovibrio exovorus JSS]
MAIVDHQKFYKDLEDKKFKPVYFLFGDEPYLLNQCVNRFKYAVLDENSTDFNYSLYYGGDADITQVKDTVETLPVFAPNRLVILKNAHDLKDSALQELESLITNPVDSTVFVMLAEKIDKRKKVIKNILDNATCVEFKKPYENQVPQWISYICKNVNLKITTDAIHRLHRLVGNNLTELENQIFKIQDYIGDKTQIDITDVNTVVSVSREESVFDFTKALGQKDRVKALEQLVNLMDQGQNEIAIVSLVARHMRLLLTVRAGMDQGYGGAKLAGLANVPSYYIESYCDQARIWPVKKIEEALIVLHETDKALKSSPLSSHIWLENLVLKSCSL